MTKVLFLQGPPSVFWRELSDGFEAQGIDTKRVNFSFGDLLYWRKRGAINYRGTLRRWPRYLADLIRREAITDIVYYADRLPYHRLAARVGRKLGVRCYAVEFGYLRPDWITLERDGMGRFSHFPDDPAAIMKIADGMSPPDMKAKYAHTFEQEATNEVIYNLASYFGRPLYPLYRSDKYYDPLIDYLSWLPRMVRKRHRLPADFFAENAPKTYLLALQLQSDYQIRGNSQYRHLSQMLDEVVYSFARHAPDKSRLVVKQHPLDNDMEGWAKVVARIADKHRVKGRVLFMEEGELAPVLNQSAGVIVVNSTTALQSLRANVPTIALGAAVYDIPGMTHQGGIDSFWKTPEPIDQKLLTAFIAAIGATIQVKGNFYNREGRKLAIETIVGRIRDGLVNEPGAFVPVPPRLAWKRLPVPQEQRSGSLLPAGLELPGKEIFIGPPEPALATVRVNDGSDKFR